MATNPTCLPQVVKNLRIYPLDMAGIAENDVFALSGKKKFTIVLLVN